jgi:small redox-active disulfide protein 2
LDEAWRAGKGDLGTGEVTFFDFREIDMEIQVLGTGCPKCKKLFDEAMKAVGQAGVAANVTKVEDIQKITEAGVMKTPALIVDGVIKCSGRVPPASEIAGWLKK